MRGDDRHPDARFSYISPEACDWARDAVSLPGASDRIAAAHNLHDALTALGDAWKDQAP